MFGGKNGDLEPPNVENSPGAPLVHRANVEDPSLPDLFNAALEVLSRRTDGFFLMAEQGVIDHMNHQNDYRGMIGTVYDLNEGVKAAIAFVNRPGDGIDWSNTLLLVTADHGTVYLRRDSAKPLGLGALPSQIGSGPYSYPNGEIIYGTMTHTNELVTLYAKGKGLKFFRLQQGLWYPGTRILDNTQIQAAITRATLAAGRCGNEHRR
jgi:alkaline phosphatase